MLKKHNTLCLCVSQSNAQEQISVQLALCACDNLYLFIFSTVCVCSISLRIARTLPSSSEHMFPALYTVKAQLAILTHSFANDKNVRVCGSHVLPFSRVAPFAGALIVEPYQCSIIRQILLICRVNQTAAYERIDNSRGYEFKRNAHGFRLRVLESCEWKR